MPYGGKVKSQQVSLSEDDPQACLKNAIFQVTELANCTVGDLHVTSVTITPKKGETGWQVNAKCGLQGEKAAWKSAGHLPKSKFDERATFLLSLLEQAALKAKIPQPETADVTADNADLVTRPSTMLQTATSIAHKAYWQINKRKSTNPHGRNRLQVWCPVHVCEESRRKARKGNKEEKSESGRQGEEEAKTLASVG
jgi:hypothetical protein